MLPTRRGRRDVNSDAAVLRNPGSDYEARGAHAHLQEIRLLVEASQDSVAANCCQELLALSALHAGRQREAHALAMQTMALIGLGFPSLSSAQKRFWSDSGAIRSLPRGETRCWVRPGRQAQGDDRKLRTNDDVIPSAVSVHAKRAT